MVWIWDNHCVGIEQGSKIDVSSCFELSGYNKGSISAGNKNNDGSVSS